MAPQLPFAGFGLCFTFFFGQGLVEYLRCRWLTRLESTVKTFCLAEPSALDSLFRLRFSIPRLRLPRPPKYAPILFGSLFGIVFGCLVRLLLSLRLSHCCYCKLCGLLFLLAHAKIADPIRRTKAIPPDTSRKPRWGRRQNNGACVCPGLARFSNQFCNCFSLLLAMLWPKFWGQLGARLLNPKLPDALPRFPLSRPACLLFRLVPLIRISLWRLFFFYIQNKAK